MYSFVILLVWAMVTRYFWKHTGARNNHEFKRSGNNYICKKCGLIKRGALK